MKTMTRATMTPRQRVMAALTHQEPDTVPLALGGGPYGLIDDLYLRLVKHLNLGKPVAPFRAGHNISYMDDRLLERLGTDTRYCWPGLLPNSPVIPGPEADTLYDSHGQVWKRALPYYYAGDGILKDATGEAVGVVSPGIAKTQPHKDMVSRNWTICFINCLPLISGITGINFSFLDEGESRPVGCKYLIQMVLFENRVVFHPQ